MSRPRCARRARAIAQTYSGAANQATEAWVGPACLGSRAVGSEVVGAGAADSGFVVRVQQIALVDREAAAADAGREAVAEGEEIRDAAVEVVAPFVREAFPVLAARGAPRRQAVERVLDLGQLDAGGAAGLHERDPAEDGAVVTALVAVRAG